MFADRIWRRWTAMRLFRAMPQGRPPRLSLKRASGFMFSHADFSYFIGLSLLLSKTRTCRKSRKGASSESQSPTPRIRLKLSNSVTHLCPPIVVIPTMCEIQFLTFLYNTAIPTMRVIQFLTFVYNAAIPTPCARIQFLTFLPRN